jgi:hypothetical protein
MKIELRIVDAEEEQAGHDAWLREQGIAGAWHQLEVQLCEDERKGHAWWLEIDPDDGLYLHCLYCPADMHDLYPDGYDGMWGEFEVHPGYVLSVNSGEVLVNGKSSDGRYLGWRGPVTAYVEVTRYPSTPDHGEEWDFSVIVVPA